MCAVIGSIIKQPTESDFTLLKTMFLQSEIRGMHATGVSWVKDRIIHTVKKPIPANEFFKDFDLKNCINEDENIYIIGHCRYSTSDLEWNQPIADQQFSVAHNGVITQASPKYWEEIYGLQCEGKNDTELLWLTLRDKKNPFKVWPEASMAVVSLKSDKSMTFFRNGKRPLHYFFDFRKLFVFSAADIGLRIGVPSWDCRLETEYTNWWLNDDLSLIEKINVESKSRKLPKDLQIKYVEV